MMLYLKSKQLFDALEKYGTVRSGVAYVAKVSLQNHTRVSTRNSITVQEPGVNDQENNIAKFAIEHSVELPSIAYTQG
jgi:hypothetical protein